MFLVVHICEKKLLNVCMHVWCTVCVDHIDNLTFTDLLVQYKSNKILTNLYPCDVYYIFSLIASPNSIMQYHNDNKFHLKMCIDSKLWQLAFQNSLHNLHVFHYD